MNKVKFINGIFSECFSLKSLPGIKLIENELGVPCIRLVEF